MITQKELSPLKKTVLKNLPLFLIFLPPLIVFIVIQLYAQNIPFNDEWQHIPLFAKLYAGKLTFADIWVAYSEHRYTIPRLITLTFGYLTNWNILTEIYFAFLLHLLSLILMWQAIKHSLEKEFLYLTYPLTFIVSLMFFSLAQGYVLLYGSISIAWVLSRLCIVVLVWVFAIWQTRWPGILIALLATVVGMFTIAIGLSLWIVGLSGILLYYFIQKDPKLLYIAIGWAVLALIFVAIYLHDYQPPDTLYNYRSPIHNPTPFIYLTEPLEATIVTFAYIGSIFGSWESYRLSAFWGFFGISSLVIIVLWVIRFAPHTIERLIPWFLLVLYGLLGAIMTTIGRFGFGVERIGVSQYVNIGIAFWTGWFVILFITQKQSIIKLFKCTLTEILAFIFITGTMIVSYIFAYQKGFNEIERAHEKLAYHLPYLYAYQTAPKEALEIFNGYHHPDVLRERARIMEYLRLGPFFNKPPTNQPNYAEPMIPKQLTEELIDGVEISQTFISLCQELSRFDIHLATHNHTNTFPIKISLTDISTGHIVYEDELVDLIKEGDAWYQFLFEPLSNSLNKPYKISLRVPNGQSEKTVAVWRSQANVYFSGEAFRNDTPLMTDILFRYSCAPLPVGITYLNLNSEPNHFFSKISWTTFNINGQSERVIHVNNAQLSWSLILPHNKQTTLETTIATNPLTWSRMGNDGVTFNIRIQTNHPVYSNETLFSKHINPANNRVAEQRFHPVQVDLGQYAGQPITLFFETTNPPNHNTAHDWGGWATPKIVVK